MTIAKRLPILLLVFSLLIFTAATIHPASSVSAQSSEPTAIIDAAIKDLGQKLGKPLSRSNVSNWTWEQLDYPDASLGCPQPGQSYAQVVTRGYHVVLTVNGVDYDYRATNDGQHIFLCSPAGSAAPTAAPVVQPVTQPTALPAVQPVAGATFQKPLSFVGPDGNVIVVAFGQAGSAILTSDAGGQRTATYPFFQAQHTYALFRWSPDGTKLLYVDTQSRTVYLAQSGLAPVAVARGVSYQYPATWSSDGSEIAYAVPTNQTQGDNGSVQQVQAVPVTTTGVGQPHYAGSFVEGVGCGGGGFDPSLIAYMDEVGYGGNGLTLAWTAQGFVYSMNCMGIGLSLSNESGQVIWSIPDAFQAAISPDRTRAIALKQAPVRTDSPSMVLIDLASGGVTALQTQPWPEQIAWSPDGSTIIYSTSAPQAAVDGNPAAPLGPQILGDLWPQSARNYDVGLWRMPVTGGASTRLFQKEGYGIGIIAPTADNSVVLFSFVPSTGHLIQAINTATSAEQVAAQIPRTQLFYVPWAGNSPAVKVSDGGRPAFSSGTFTAVSGGPAVASQPTPVTNPPSNVEPPKLVIGGRAVVITTKGDTLNVRRSPTRSAQVLRILKPGAVVIIQAGPQLAEGFRWWQVQTTDDGSVGWVVDQVTDQDGTTNTLAPQ